MSTIVTRAGKGSTLTFAEVDANFTNLNTDKLEFSSEPVRHSVRPSLLLDFANTKQLDPRITFTRASTATFYDGRTTAKAEENLLANSKDFTNVAYGWYTNSGFYATVTINDTTAPDGTTTGAKLAATATTNNFLRCQDSKQTVSTITTVSWFVKAGDVSWVALRNLAVSGSPYVWFNLSTGVVGTQQSGLTGSIQSVGSGWYRCSITGTTASSIANNFIDIVPCASDNSQTVAIGNYIYIWGAQIESRSAVSAYTPTTTAAITNYIPALQTAASGVARFDHNPTTGESLGLLIEEQRVNLLTRSDDFANASWIKNQSTPLDSNVLIAPDGTLTADFVKTLVGSFTHGIYQSYSGTTGQTFSVYAKAGDASLLTLDTNAAGTSYAVFNLSTGVVVSSLGNTASITPVGNGWYRCVIANTTSATLYGVIGVRESYTSGNPWAASTGTGKGIYIWGAQLEAGAFATSYIPTVASQVTRSPDAASITGTNFSSWYRADEGTVYTETVDGMPATSSARGIWSIDDGTTSNRLDLRRQTSTDIQNFITVNGVTQANLSYGYTAVNGVSFKNATVYKFNDIAGTLNSGTIQADSSAQIPVVSGLRIGVLQASSVYLSGSIKKLAYYPKRLTNAELAGLTTV